MIIVSLFLMLAVGLLLLARLGISRSVSLFEMIGLSLITWIGVINVLFLSGTLLVWSVSSRFTTIVSVVLFVISLVTLKKNHRSELAKMWQEQRTNIAVSWKSMKMLKKLLVVACVWISLIKLFRIFSINVSRPAYDEDAVGWWDMKTKVIFEHKGVPFDRTSPEFMGGSLDRSPIAALIDTSFILWYKDIPITLTNVLSPLLFLCFVLILFWIFLRRSNLLRASGALYASLSLPFLFVQAMGPYMNIVLGVALFVAVYYFHEKITAHNWEGSKRNFLVPIACAVYISMARNEWLYLFLLMIAVLLASRIVFYDKKAHILKSPSLWIFWWIMVLFLAVQSYFWSFQSSDVNYAAGYIWWSLVSNLLTNISNAEILFAPFKQILLHPDFNFLYLLALLSAIVLVIQRKKMAEMVPFALATAVLIIAVLVVLWANPEKLGLLTHFSFIRYGVIITPFILFFVGRTMYLFFDEKQWQ